MKTKLLAGLMLSALATSTQAATMKIIKSPDGVFDKPVIIAEGYDPLNEYNEAYYESAYSTLINQVTADGSGRDIVLVNFANGGASISTNANELVTIINSVNTQKVGNYPNAVVGISMGGLVARWALKHMENLGQSHNTSLYVSFDSPHRGANLPKDIRDHIEDYADFIDIGFGVPSEISKARRAYDTPAGQQMLIWGDSAKGFYQQLEMKGYPNNLARVAIVNGSKGNSYGLSENQTPLSYKMDFTIRDFHHSVKFKSIENCEFPCDRTKYHFYDNAPGSFLTPNPIQTFRDGLQEAAGISGVSYSEYTFNLRDYNFISTYSALDIRNHNISQPLSEDTISKHSPFDLALFNSSINRPHNYINVYQFKYALNQYHNGSTVIPSRTHKVAVLKDVENVRNTPMGFAGRPLAWDKIAGASHYKVFVENSAKDLQLFTTTTNDYVNVFKSWGSGDIYVQACNAERCSYPIKSIEYATLGGGRTGGTCTPMMCSSEP